MKNEYGVTLDSNKYAPSIMQTCFSEGWCKICGKGGDLARHEVFPASLRTKSKMYGLWVLLCPSCHREIHASKSEANKMKQRAQIQAMNYYGWTIEDWRERFGKSYI